MQAPDDSPFADAVDAPTRAPLVALRADWAGDGTYSHPYSDMSTLVTDLSVDRSWVGDLPPECTLIEGYATAKLSATLAGGPPGALDIARALSPWRTDIPNPVKDQVGVAVTCDLGLTTTGGPRLLRQFTGTTRSVELSSADRTAVVEALDGSERLRQPITLPLAAEDETYWKNRANYGVRFWTNTQWVVDYVLRRNGIYMSPPPRPDCLWSMTCHGGLIAEVGRANNYWSGTGDLTKPSFVPGLYGLAANGGTAMVVQILADPSTVVPLDQMLFEFIVLAGGSNTFNQNADGELLSYSTWNNRYRGATFEVGITTNGTLTVSVWSDSSKVATVNGPRITGAAAWHSVGVLVSYQGATGALTTQWQVDGTVGQPSTTTITKPTLTSGATLGDVRATTSLPVQCMQISKAASAPANWGKPYVSQADIDTGLNWFSGLPDIVNADSWDVIRQAVGAEYGIVGFAEDGRFSFVNRETARTRAAAAPVRSLTAAVSLADLKSSTTVDSVRNYISGRTSPRLQTASTVKVWSPTGIHDLDTPSGVAKDFYVDLGKRSVVGWGSLALVKASSFTPDSYNSFAAVNASTGADVANVSLYVRQFFDDAVVLTVTNNSAYNVSISNLSTPTLNLFGTAMTDAATTEQTWGDYYSQRRYGTRSLSIPDNPFRQLPDSINTIGQSLLRDLSNPAPVLADVPVPGDPRLQLGDVVDLSDPDGLGGPIRAHIIGIRRALSDTDGLSDTLTLRAEPPNGG